MDPKVPNSPDHASLCCGWVKVLICDFNGVWFFKIFFILCIPESDVLKDILRYPLGKEGFHLLEMNSSLDDLLNAEFKEAFDEFDKVGAVSVDIAKICSCDSFYRPLFCFSRF